MKQSPLTYRHDGEKVSIKMIDTKELINIARNEHLIRTRLSIEIQIYFWSTYCTWRHNTITYNVAHERVNVELSEYAAYNPYC